MNTYLKETLKENDEILYQVTHVAKSAEWIWVSMSFTI